MSALIRQWAADMAAPKSLEQQREEFEQAVFRERFIRSIKFHPNKQFADCDCPPKDVIMARSKDRPDQYADDAIEAIWLGWRLARGIE